MGDMNAGTFFVESNFRSTVQNRYNVFFKPTLIVVPVLVMSGKKTIQDVPFLESYKMIK